MSCFFLKTNKPINNAQNYNNYTNKPIINNQNYSNNVNKQISEGTYNEFNQNPIEVPILKDGINSPPTPFSGGITTNNTNNPIYPTPEPVLNVYNENNNQGNIRKSRFYENTTNNNNNINKSFAEFDDRKMSKSEIKKEISSDVLDNLFNMNIGKELKPDDEIEVEK